MPNLIQDSVTSNKHNYHQFALAKYLVNLICVIKLIGIIDFKKVAHNYTSLEFEAVQNYTSLEKLDLWGFNYYSHDDIHHSRRRKSQIKSNGMCIFVIQIGFDWIMHYSLSQSKYIDNQHIKRSLNKID